MNFSEKWALKCIHFDEFQVLQHVLHSLESLISGSGPQILKIEPLLKNLGVYQPGNNYAYYQYEEGPLEVVNSHYNAEDQIYALFHPDIDSPATVPNFFHVILDVVYDTSFIMLIGVGDSYPLQFLKNHPVNAILELFGKSYPQYPDLIIRDFDQKVREY